MKKRAGVVAAVIGALGLTFTGVAGPAQAASIPSCVSWHTTNAFPSAYVMTSQGFASNNCSYSVSGRWQIKHASGYTYTSCSTMLGYFGKYNTGTYSWSSWANDGSIAYAFVPCVL
jgi:hypothetical protein